MSNASIVASLACFLLVFVVAIIFCIQDIAIARKFALLESFGFHRFLFVRDARSGNVYAWSDDNYRLMESEVKRLSYKELKAVLWLVVR